MVEGRAQTPNFPHFLLDRRGPQRPLGVMSAPMRERPGAEGRGLGGHRRMLGVQFAEAADYSGLGGRGSLADLQGARFTARGDAGTA